MFKFCSNCARTNRTDEYGEWTTECRYCCHNPEIGICEYDSHWIQKSDENNTTMDAIKKE